MKNQYFQRMQKEGRRFRKIVERGGGSITQETPKPFSKGQSFAYKFWAIAEHYNSTDILVDELPDENELKNFIDTYRCAGISTIVLTGEALSRIDDLKVYGCVEAEECKVFRQENILYQGKLETIKGIRIIINR